MGKLGKPSRCPLNPDRGERLPHSPARHHYLWTGVGEEVRCKWCGRKQKKRLYPRMFAIVKSRELWQPLPTHTHRDPPQGNVQ